MWCNYAEVSAELARVSNNCYSLRRYVHPPIESAFRYNLLVQCGCVTVHKQKKLVCLTRFYCDVEGHALLHIAVCYMIVRHLSVYRRHIHCV